MLSTDEYVKENLSRLDQYIKAVLDGGSGAGQYEVKTVQRFLQLKQKYIWDEKALVKVLRLFSLLRIPTVNAGVIQASLPGYQLLWLAAQYALVVDNGNRLITSCYYNVAKKNSKSTFTSLCCILECAFDGDPQAEVIICANSQSQARIILKYCGEIINASPLVKDYFQVFKNSIVSESNTGNNTIKAITTEGSTTQGYNASTVIADEAAFSKSLDILEKLRTGTIARNNKLQIVVTTAGDNRLFPCYELHRSCEAILNGDVEADSVFCAIYSFDDYDKEGSDPIPYLRKTNPSLGEILKQEALINDYEKAKLIPYQLLAFKRDHLNMWLDDALDKVWIDSSFLRTAMKKNQTIKPGSRIWVGCDFSSHRDLSGIFWLAYDPTGRTFITDCKIILPNNDQNTIRAGSIDLQPWIDQGHIIRCATKSLDDELVLGIFEELNRTYKIINIGYDGASLGRFIADKILYRIKKPTTEVKQNNYSLGLPLQVIERYILNGQMSLPPNPTLLYMAKNVRIFTDTNNNPKIMKKQSEAVDAWVALNIAMNVFLQDNPDTLMDFHRKAS